MCDGGDHQSTSGIWHSVYIEVSTKCAFTSRVINAEGNKGTHVKQVAVTSMNTDQNPALPSGASAQ